MSNIITLEQFKQNSRIDDDYEDEFIQEIILPSAESFVLGLLRRTLENITEVEGEIPSWLKHATLMAADDMYRHRGMTENYTPQSNPAFTLLIKKHIKLTK